MKEIDSLAFANVQLNFRDAIKKYNSEYDIILNIKENRAMVKVLYANKQTGTVVHDIYLSCRED